MTHLNDLNIDPRQLQMLVSVIVAMLLGAVIGWDREHADKPAGFRTHMLVAGAAALLVGLSDVAVSYFSLREGPANVTADPVRIIEAVITGISFIGAGTIIRSQRDGSVEGITTATSILFVAGIGMAVALDQILLAIGSTLLVLTSLLFVKWFTASDKH